MSSLSFRTKLLLAMMFIVLLVTVATLVATQHKVEDTYGRLFQDQFEAQVSAFSARQEARLGVIRDRCELAAGNVRLRSAVEDELDPAEIYSKAADELRLAGFYSIPSTPRFELGESSAKRKTKPLGEPFVRFLSGEGKVIHPPDAGDELARQKVERQLRFIGGAVGRLEEQQVGYVTRETAGGKSQLLEVVVTPIALPDGHNVGALIVGFPLSDSNLGEKTLNAISQLRSGIWLENEIYSKTIPDAVRESLVTRVADRMKSSSGASGDFTLDVEGVPHRAFYRLLNPNSLLPAASQVCLYSLAASVEAQSELRGRILGFGGLALLLAFGLSLAIANGLAVPIRELVAGTTAIKRGQFTTKVPIRSRDELGQLAASFNEMADGLALKEKYHNVLNMVADRDVAEQLVRGEVKLGGERREVSILFCDIRGFTSLAQGMRPEEVIAMLNTHMTALTSVVHEHQGVVDKFVGDLIMALFGAPKSYGHDALRAALCALQMIDERGKLNRQSERPIQIGIGIATGEVVAGCMGASNRIDYTVLGERVNLASRLCGQAEPGQILVDQETRKRLKDSFVTQELQPRKLKGYEEPVRVWVLEGAASRNEQGPIQCNDQGNRTRQ
jgi:class 3 adenylate cyclase